MARYEFVEGSSKKFWEVELAGKDVTTKWGRIGTPGAFKTKAFPSPAAAQKEHDKLVREKTTKGYTLIAAKKGAKVAAKPAKGARQVTDGKLAPEMVGEPRMPSLEKSIKDDPDDDGPFTVYGDWLAQQGHPRGELATAQISGNAKLAKKLLDKHTVLWGDLAGLKDIVTNVVWKGGFIERARIANSHDRSSEYGGDKPEVKIDELVGKLLDGPGRFLRDLTVGIVRFESNSYQSVIAAIAKRKPLSTLRSIYFGDFTSDETELNWSSIGDLTKLYAAVPNLQTLKLRSGDLKMGKIDLPELRHLSIYTGGLDTASGKAIAEAKWPKLEKLDVMFGQANEGAMKSAKGLQPLFDAKAVPKLTWLGIKNFEFHRELIPMLLGSKLLRQLSVVDLSMGTLGDEEADLLVAGKSHLAHLTELVVADNFLTAKGIKALKQLGIPVTSKGGRGGRSYDQNSLGQRDVEDPEEDERFASVYE